jgi:NADH/F420H2 dehydrogenase subunit C
MKKNSIVTSNLKYLKKVLPLIRIQVYSSDITLIADKNLLKNILFFLKNSILCQFNLITCISGVDYPTNTFRFNIVYDLLSLKYNSRIRIKVYTHELLPVPSSIDIFPASNWFESEIWDMFGIFFTKHPNLKRLLTDYGFNGYPLRKDFPVSGFVEMRFNEDLKRVFSESIEFSQEYRTFHFVSPWQSFRN